MSIRPEDFYGGALHFEVGSDTEILNLARVMSFDTQPGSWTVNFPDSSEDLAKRMDYTWLGGPNVVLINNGPGQLTVTFKVRGKDLSIGPLDVGQRAIVTLIELNNILPSDDTGDNIEVVLKNDGRIASASPFAVMQDVDGIVHNGGDPGGTGVELNDLPTGTWSSLAASPNAHGDAAGWGMTQGLHLVGNNQGTTIRQRHSRYRSAAWSTRTDYPTEQEGGNAGTLKTLGKAIGYVFEGDASATLVNKPLVTRDYDDQADAYTAKASQPHPTDSGGSASDQASDRIMLIRGLPLQQASWLFHGPSGTYESTDFYTGVAKRSMSAFLQFGRIYSCGGYDDNGAAWFSTSDQFTIPTRTWVLGGALPAQRSTGAAFAWRGVGIYAGGEDNLSTPRNTVFRMNNSSTWFSTTNKIGANERSTQHGAEIAV
jgi:hypothetical protein